MLILCLRQEQKNQNGAQAHLKERKGLNMLPTKHGDVLGVTRITHILPMTRGSFNYEGLLDEEEAQGIYLSEVLEKEYKKPFSIVYNGAVHISIPEDVLFSAGEVDEFNFILTTGRVRGHYELIYFLRDLIHKGILPTGEYVVYADH